MNKVDVIAPHTGDSIIVKITSTLNQGYTDESWGFSDIKIAALDANKDCPDAYAQCDDPDLQEVDDVCDNAGDGWAHVRHVTVGEEVAFQGVPQDGYTVSYAADHVNYQDGVWTLTNNHNVNFDSHQRPATQWHDHNFKITFKAKFADSNPS